MKLFVQTALIVSAVSFATSAAASTLECKTDRGTAAYTLVLNASMTDATIYSYSEESQNDETLYLHSRVKSDGKNLFINASDDRILDWDNEPRCFRWLPASFSFRLEKTAGGYEGNVQMYAHIETRPGVEDCSHPRPVLPPLVDLTCAVK